MRKALCVVSVLGACSPGAPPRPGRAPFVPDPPAYPFFSPLTTLRAQDPLDPRDPPVEMLWLEGARGCAKTRSGVVACWNAEQDPGVAPEGFVQAAWSEARCRPLCAYPASAPNQSSLLAHEAPPARTDDGCTISKDRALRCTGDLPTPELDAVALVRVSHDGGPGACAMRRDRSVWCWGAPDSAYGRLAREAGAQSKPLQVHFAQEGNPDAAVVDLVSPRTADPTCLSHRPCERETRALPVCGKSSEARDWRDLLPRAEWVLGREVVVRGALRVAPIYGCTLGYCGGQCCNECGSDLALGAQDPTLMFTLLEGVGRCVGDESRLCCPFEASGQTVIAEGTLARPLLGRNPYALRVTSLCRVPDLAPPLR